MGALLRLFTLQQGIARAGLRFGLKAKVVPMSEGEACIDADKPAVLRPYLERWAFEVGRFFDGVGADSTDEQLAAIAPKHPVFALEISPR